MFPRASALTANGPRPRQRQDANFDNLVDNLCTTQNHIGPATKLSTHRRYEKAFPRDPTIFYYSRMLVAGSRAN